MLQGGSRDVRQLDSPDVRQFSRSDSNLLRRPSPVRHDPPLRLSATPSVPVPPRPTAAATRTTAESAPAPVDRRAEAGLAPAGRLRQRERPRWPRVPRNLFRGLGGTRRRRRPGDRQRHGNEVNLPIEDNKVLVSTLNVADDVDVQLLQLDLDLTHSYRGDLVVTLVSPAGTRAVISNREGRSADDLRGSFDPSVFEGERSEGRVEAARRGQGEAGSGPPEPLGPGDRGAGRRPGRWSRPKPPVEPPCSPRSRPWSRRSRRSRWSRPPRGIPASRG